MVSEINKAESLLISLFSLNPESVKTAFAQLSQQLPEIKLLLTPVGE